MENLSHNILMVTIATNKKCRTLTWLGRAGCIGVTHPTGEGDSTALWVKGAGCRVHGRHKGMNLEIGVGAGQGLPRRPAGAESRGGLQGPGKKLCFVLRAARSP